MKIAILTDSSTNHNFIKNEEIFSVPLCINYAKGTKTIKDDGSINEEDFYNLLNNEEDVKTSHTIVGDIYKKLDELLKNYDHIICCLISKGLSGQMNTFNNIIQDDAYKGKVTIVDSNGVSVTNSRTILKIKELIKNNKTPIEIKQIIEDKIKNKLDNKFGFILVKSLDQLVKGGRISKSVALLAKITKIFPILKYNGLIDREMKVRLFDKAILYCVNWFKENNIKKIDFSYSKCDKATYDKIIDEFNKVNIEIGLIEKLPYTITIHTGQNTFALINSEVFD